MKAETFKNKIHFIGHAKVTKLNDWIHANEIIIYFDEHNETKMYKAFGNASFEFKNEKGHYTGRGNMIKYYPKRSVYELTEKANIKDLLNGRTAKGDKITLDMLTGKSYVQGKKNAPVVFTLEIGK
jgi:lipopolysaccharide export system protein LptA